MWPLPSSRDPYLDFRFLHPHLDFLFRESFRITIICWAIANLSWPSLRLSAWQSWVHDSLECMTVSSAWHSWVHDSHDWITLRLPFARDDMIAADFDFRIWDPHLDFYFRDPLHNILDCMTVSSEWQSRVHDSLYCMMFMSAWQSWLNNT